MPSPLISLASTRSNGGRNYLYRRRFTIIITIITLRVFILFSRRRAADQRHNIAIVSNAFSL